MKLRRRSGLEIVMVSILLIALAPPAFAATVVHSFGITVLGQHESYLMLTTQPGKTISKEIEITNLGSVTGTATIFSVDAHTGSRGGIDFPTTNSTQKEVGAWIHLSKSAITLNPQQKSIIAITITIPQKVRNGSHIGGIMVKNTTPESGGAHIAIANVTGIGVFITIPGPTTENIAATGIQVKATPGAVAVATTLMNRGSAITTLSGTVEVRGLLQQTAVKLGKFLPGDTIEYPLPITGTIIPGKTYTVILKLNYGQGHRLTYQKDFMVTSTQAKTITRVNQTRNLVVAASTDTTQPIPILIAVLLGVILASGMLILLRTVRKKRREATRTNE